MNDNIRGLIERIEAAAGPDRELDALIYAQQLGDVEWIGNVLRAAGVNLGAIDPGERQRNWTTFYAPTTFRRTAMASDLIERLQSHMGKADIGEVLADCRLAADRIASLEAEVAALRETVAQFVDTNDRLRDIVNRRLEKGE